LGVIGMKERADMLGGKITIESTPGQGTTILLEVPCQFES
jgi:two-component system, sensor kinase